MVNYQEGKIYKIYSTIDDSVCYVGSTTKTLLCQRMVEHRKDYRGWKEKKRHQKVSSFDLFDKFGIENCIIELLELCPCNSKDELNKKEGEYIRSLNCVNQVVTGRTKKEYRIDNKLKLNEKKKTYYKENKEKINENCKEYYKDNKEKILETVKKYSIENKEKISEQKKGYRKNNEEKISYIKKLYYENNKENINENAKQKITCECGSCIRKSDKAKHCKSQKHIDYIQNLNITDNNIND